MNNVREFLEEAPTGTARVLQGLAVAESLTDPIARRIYELEPIEGITGEQFVEVLHLTNFVVPRNSEWHFVEAFRLDIRSLDSRNKDYLSAVHQLLLKEGETGEQALAGDQIPAYLFSKGGRAYHAAALGQVASSLALYSEMAKGPPSGEQWLAGKLAEEQQLAGILPESAIEPAFLRGMSLYGEEMFERAEPYFRRVTSSKSCRREVAIAFHLVGVIEARRGRFEEALVQFDRSIELYEFLPMRFGLHMVLSSRARAKREIGDLDGALADIDWAVTLTNGNDLAKVLVGRSEIKRDLNDLDGALADLDLAIKLGEGVTLAYALSARSLVRRDMGDLEGALKDLDELRKLAMIPGLGIDRRKVALRHKNFRKFRNELEKASSEDARRKMWRDYFYDIAVRYNRSMESSRALVLFRKAIALDVERERYAGCMFGLGKDYARLDRLDEAVRCFQEAIDGGWEGAEVRSRLAYALTQLGKPLETTRALYESAIAEEDGNAWAKSWFALALSAAGEHSAAEAWARAAVASFPDDENAILLFNLARVLDATGDVAKRKEAIVVAKRSARLARPGFRQPDLFLRERQVDDQD